MTIFFSLEDPEVVLVTYDREFPVDRSLLSAQSSFFHKMFYENELIEGKMNRMTIKADSSALEIVLQHIYCGTIDLEGKDIDDILAVLGLARTFLLSTLEKNLIEEVLIPMIDMDNYYWMVTTASRYDSEPLRQKCDSFMKERANKFLESGLLKNSSLAEVLEMSNEDLGQLMNDHFDNKHGQQAESATKKIPAEAVDNSVQAGVLEEGLGTERIVGQNHSNLFSTTKFVSGNDIVVDLGSSKLINCIKFNLNELSNYEVSSTTVYEYPEEADPKQISWCILQTFEYCKFEQKVYFTPVKTRYIRISGNARYSTPTNAERMIEINAFKALYVDNLPTSLENYMLSPKTNIFTPENAYITDMYHDVLPNDALTWNGVERGRKTSFTESQSPAMYFWLKQPSILSRIRFRLWDFDGSRHIKVWARYSDKKSIRITRDLNMFGWQYFDLPKDKYTHFLFDVIEGQPATVVHFEGSA